MRLDRIPNLLTMGRVVLTLAYPFAPGKGRIAILVVALVTEYLDGASSCWQLERSPRSST